MNALSKRGSKLGFRRNIGHCTTFKGLFGFIFLSLLGASGQAWSADYHVVHQWPFGHSFAGWPSADNSGWTASHSLDDPHENGKDELNLNFVGDSNNPGFYTAQKNGYLFFRIRVEYAGTVTAPETNNSWASPF